jgi:membrane-bound ClpP family serine protease
MMKTAKYLGCGAELLLLGIVIWSYRFGTAVGVVATVAWLLFGFGIMSIVGWDLANPSEPSTPHQPKRPQHRGLIGAVGNTISVLNPTGMIEVAGERVEATSAMGLIQTGVPVDILDAKGNNVVVAERKKANRAVDGTSL